MPTPTKKTSEQELSEINAQLRANPAYVEFLQSMGIDPSGPIKLTDQQREQAKQFLASQGVPLEGGMEIDPAGNINQNEGVGKWAKDWRTYAAIGAGIAGLGVAGIGPAAGLFGSGAASAPAAGGSLASAGAVGSAPAYVPGSMIGMGLGGSAGAGAGAAGSAGFFGKAAGMLGGNTGQLFGAAGAALGAGAQSAAHNRGVQFDADIAGAQLKQQAERDYNDQMLKREDEGRKKQRNAWEMMNRGAYMKNAPDNLNTTMLSPYSKAIAGPDAGQRAAATGMFDQMSQHLSEGNTMEKPTRVGADVKVGQPGFFEKWGGIIGPGMTTWELLNNR